MVSQEGSDNGFFYPISVRAVAFQLASVCVGWLWRILEDGAVRRIVRT